MDTKIQHECCGCHAIVGSPEFFRLRYGWVSDCQSSSGTLQACIQQCCLPKNGSVTVEGINKRIAGSEDNNQFQNDELMDPLPVSQTSGPNSAHPAIGARKRSDFTLNDNIMESSETAGNSFCCAAEASDEAVRQQKTGDEMRLNNNIPPSAGEWADCLTDISIGSLLDVSLCNDISDNCIRVPTAEIPQCIPQSSFTCDSFDAAIAAHISRYQIKLPYESNLPSHESSIWDAEETCDAFSFQRSTSVCKDGTIPSGTSCDNAEHRRITDPVGSGKAESRGMQEFTGNL